MQRSRRALLQRRAVLENATSERKHLYKVSLSVVIISWCFIFVLSTLINRGNSFKDVDGMEIVRNETISDEVNVDQIFTADDLMVLEESKLNNHDHSTHTENVDGDINGDQSSLTEVNEENIPHIKRENDLGQISDTESKVEMIYPSKNDRLSRVATPSLDEFKIKALTSKEKQGSGQVGSVRRRVEPGGKEYNYASSSRGAKVLAFNKEAKGASNILDKDKDKYLRNPCSAEDKYVIIELSEETLVDTVEIANFEHYSSNLKEFELLSSLVYPTDSWEKIGNFTAANVKHTQRFQLIEAKWTRYLKVNLLSHHGSEFYCTLSLLEVYGVDAIERMLENLISVQDKRFIAEEPIFSQPLELEITNENDNSQGLLDQIDNESRKDSTSIKQEITKSNDATDSFSEARSQLGRIPSDTVLKILMQKVQLLDVNSAVLERYLEELNNRYGQIFKDIDNDISHKELLIEQLRSEIKDIQNSKELLAKDLGDLLAWKSFVSSRLDMLIQDNAFLSSEIAIARDTQVHAENRSLAAVFISFVFGCFAAFKIVIDLLLSFCGVHIPENFCRSNSCWTLLLLCSSIVSLTLVL